MILGWPQVHMYLEHMNWQQVNARNWQRFFYMEKMGWLPRVPRVQVTSACAGGTSYLEYVGWQLVYT